MHSPSRSAFSISQKQGWASVSMSERWTKVLIIFKLHPNSFQATLLLKYAIPLNGNPARIKKRHLPSKQDQLCKSCMILLTNREGEGKSWESRLRPTRKEGKEAPFLIYSLNRKEPVENKSHQLGAPRKAPLDSNISAQSCQRGGFFQTWSHVYFGCQSIIKFKYKYSGGSWMLRFRRSK